MLKKNNWANFQRIIEVFTQKIVTKLSKIWVWDKKTPYPGFGIPYPGVKKTPDPGSGSACNTALSAEYHTVVVILRYTPEFTIFLVCLKNFILLGRCIAARNRTSVVFAARPQQHDPTTTVISRPMLPGKVTKK
jgi:hypothetical protein